MSQSRRIQFHCSNSDAMIVVERPELYGDNSDQTIVTITGGQFCWLKLDKINEETVRLIVTGAWEIHELLSALQQSLDDSMVNRESEEVSGP